MSAAESPQSLQVRLHAVPQATASLSVATISRTLGTLAAPACLQAAAHQQELQLLHKQYAAILQDTLSKMRSKLQDEYNAACEGA